MFNANVRSLEIIELAFLACVRHDYVIANPLANAQQTQNLAWPKEIG